MDSSNPCIIFSVFYWLAVFCFIVGPAEIKSAGITVENFLSSWLGSEEMDFVNFHIRRTSATVVVHCLLPFGYFVGMSFVEDSGASFNALFSSTLSFQWHIYSTVSLLSLLGSLTVIYYWQMNDWSNHPIVKDLSMYVDRDDGDTRSVWRIKASEINNEFRRIDKFTTSLVGWTRVIVTEHWIVLTSLYGLKFVPQDQATVSVFETEEHDVSPESNEMVQYLRLRIKPTIRIELKPFFARILSLEFKDLKESLRCRVYTLPHLSILQTTNEIFLKAFREQVNKNEKYSYDEEADSCIGCMQKPSEVKLVKNCGSEDPNGCKSCNCKPLWCVDCMGRWYASRQDQNHTETWLSGFATCPMCRARFCMLDISLVQA